MGMSMKSVGREGCTVWLWLLEVVREVPSKVLCTQPSFWQGALPKSTTDASVVWGS